MRATVEAVLADIRVRGDEAVREYSGKFDKWSPESFRLSREEIEAAIARVPEQTIADIKTVQENVRRFAELQRNSLSDFEAEVAPGVLLGQKNIPVNAVGAYVPGGRYPLLASAHQEVTDRKASAQLGELLGRAARAERFEGHARSGDARAARGRGTRPDWALAGAQE
ncbi:histidinol dehydrogenase [Dactylosporangium sucinum]|uniref:histidinol dehydrogenase n=1 Tax=Dactylosporangium sucinum TaxID=1424081 RepID=UPI001E62DF02|nr:histidinol dehydrogenase [Dactylosporangium sucinum]